MRHDLDTMSRQSIETVSAARLKPLSDICIPRGAPGPEKIRAFVEQAGNPYCFRSGNTPVGLRFTQKGTTMAQALERILLALGQG